MHNNLTKSILATIVYYDVFDYPLSAFEIWKYRTVQAQGQEYGNETPVTLEDIMVMLDTESIKRSIGNRQGLYFVRGREMLVKRRLRRGKLSIAKYRGVHNLVFWLRFVPFVRSVALTGSLAMKNSEISGDWDLLITLRSGHIWTGRAVLSALLQCFGKRRHDTDIADRACLNYWVTTTSLEIITKDLFSSNEYFFITPLFGYSVFQKFQEKNSWIRRFRPQYKVSTSPHLMCIQDSFFSKFSRDIGEILLSDRWLERKLSLWQKKKIAANPKTRLPGSFIEATDEALIFLPKPQGPKVFAAFKDRLSEIEALS